MSLHVGFPVWCRACGYRHLFPELVDEGRLRCPQCQTFGQLGHCDCSGCGQLPLWPTTSGGRFSDGR